MAAAVHGGSREWQNKREEAKGLAWGWRFKYRNFFPWHISGSDFFPHKSPSCSITIIQKGFSFYLLLHFHTWVIDRSLGHKPLKTYARREFGRLRWFLCKVQHSDLFLVFLTLHSLNTCLQTKVFPNDFFGSLCLWSCRSVLEQRNLEELLFTLLNTFFIFNCCSSVPRLIMKGRRNCLCLYHEVGSHRTKRWPFCNLTS